MNCNTSIRYYEDAEDSKHLNAEDWQLECLKLNPEYCEWGNGSEYMSDKKEGWDRSIYFEEVKDGLFELDDYNECVNFYFEVYRPSKECFYCGRTGLNSETKQLDDDWYDFAKTGREWCDKLTQLEVDALWDAGRLKFDFKEKPTADQVNAWQKSKPFGHDSINKGICVRTRAQHLGVYGLCEHCEGRGELFTELKAKLALQLWILHPRKSCSRGIRITDVKKGDLPTVYKWLSNAGDRNMKRFEKVKCLNCTGGELCSKCPIASQEGGENGVRNES